MKITQRTSQVVLLALLMLLLSSCSVPDEWYINNESTETLAISLLPDSPREGALAPGLFQQLTQLAEYSKEGERITFSLAPNSTAYIGGAVGGYTPFTSLDVRFAGEEISLNRQNAAERFVVVHEEPA
jgi:hypothetical protein